MKPAPSKNRALCLWLPQWPIQRLRLARPQLKHQELVLYGAAHGCLRVTAISKAQLRIGMPLAEAQAVITAHFEQHDPGADLAGLLRLASNCEQFSPVVGIETPDNLALDVTGLGQLFGGEELLAQQIVREFHRWGLSIRLSIADTFGAAWANAHFGNKIVILPGDTAEALARLPVCALRFAGTELLTELGIERIGQLLALPRDALASRFDSQLLHRLDQALGVVAEPIQSHRTPPDITAGTQLEHPTENKETVDFLLSQLIDRICRTLNERQQGAIRLECQLRCENGESIRCVVGMYRASANTKHLLKLTRMQLDQIIAPGPIAAINLSVLIATPLSSWQQELFESSQRNNHQQVGLLVDLLSNRLGREAVVRAVPQAEAQPELAFRYEPLAGNAPRKVKQQRWKLLPRPLRLEPKPIPLKVLSVVPSGPPVQFQFHGLQRIAKTWGPERIQTGWWRGRYVQRDYYRVETTTGRRFWLFRRLPDGQWFLHGSFD